MNAPNGAPRPPPASAAPALAAGWAAVLAAGIDRAAIASVVESLRADLWLTDARLGALAAAAVLASLALAPAVASLAASRRPSRVLALGLTVAAAGTMLSGAARRALALLAARLATGAAPAARTAAGAGAAPGDAALPAAVAGAAAGYAVGAVLSRLVGWRWALAAAGVPGLLAAIACLRARGRLDLLPETLPWRGEDGLVAELRRLRADRERALAATAFAATILASSAMAFWTIAFLERRRGVPRAIAGLEFGVVVLMGGLAGTLLGARSVERVRPRAGAAAERWVAGAAAFAAAPLAVMAYAGWRPRTYLVGLVLAQLLLLAAAHTGAAAIGRSVPAAGAGRGGRAATAAVVAFAAALGPWLVGLVSDRTSLGRALAVVVPLALCASGAAWLWGASRARRGGGRPGSVDEGRVTGSSRRSEPAA